ncbi:putative O-methyltransferase COMT-type, S-adenosyl-L-methionine-dependent methyltransferase [Rosa chinensis]|uniref:Putative O-methyltransferase COMT-type, S-adenosyl-L-methionine-dependent methyltransferase n=2 Tax=Rosa chinensis TaxID=74649 RepID=A0A2P6PSX8_ROSCH|nr:putative O-methyltransferase COMT-type, S-adenosyl-L-methionine-dependent methyltransferase [Rosa chinensis]
MDYPKCSLQLYISHARSLGLAKKKMEHTQRKPTLEEKGEERAKVEVWNYVLGFSKIAVVKCAIELGIADAIESHGSPMTLLELSKTLKCDPSSLYRIMRFLVHQKIFKEVQPKIPSDPKSYAQSPLSRCLLKFGENSMAAMILLESSPVMLAPWHCLSARILGNGTSTPAFEAVHGEDIWSFAAANPGHSELINEAMACDACLALPALIDSSLEVFNGIETIVDVGGGNGTTLGFLVKACAWITRGINFDLPHVVSVAEESDRVENVGGDMFDCIPKADAAIIKSVLHDWGDEECIRILKKCKEAIPEDKGKVIILEAVIEEDEIKDELTDVRLMLDMVMMAHTSTGKERTLKEWGYVIGEAGFSRHTVTPINAVQSVIQAFP